MHLSSDACPVAFPVDPVLTFMVCVTKMIMWSSCDPGCPWTRCKLSTADIRAGLVETITAKQAGADGTIETVDVLVAELRVGGHAEAAVMLTRSRLPVGVHHSWT